MREYPPGSYHVRRVGMLDGKLKKQELTSNRAYRSVVEHSSRKVRKFEGQGKK